MLFLYMAFEMIKITDYVIFLRYTYKIYFIIGYTGVLVFIRESNYAELIHRSRNRQILRITQSQDMNNFDI